METVFLGGLGFSLWHQHVLDRESSPLDRESSPLPQLTYSSQKAASRFQLFIYSEDKQIWGASYRPHPMSGDQIQKSLLCRDYTLVGKIDNRRVRNTYNTRTII